MLRHSLSLTILPLVQFHVEPTVFMMIAIATCIAKQHAALLVMYYKELPRVLARILLPNGA